MIHICLSVIYVSPFDKCIFDRIGITLLRCTDLLRRQWLWSYSVSTIGNVLLNTLFHSIYFANKIVFLPAILFPYSSSSEYSMPSDASSKRWQSIRPRTNREKSVKNETHDRNWGQKIEKREELKYVQILWQFFIWNGSIALSIGYICDISMQINAIVCVCVCCVISCYVWNGDHVCSALWLFAIYVCMSVGVRNTLFYLRFVTC